MTPVPAHARLAIVTGADSGIGKATADLLATEKFDVGITFHSDESGAQDTKANIEERGQRCFVLQQDASSPDTGRVVDELAAQLGGLGVLLCAQRAARLMRDAGRGGRIVNITSVHETVPRVGSTAYSTAKAGLGMVTKCLALELAPYGITVNSVAPGDIATPMTGKEEQEAYDVKRPGNPVGRPGHVNEVASVIAFLASPRSSDVTGASLTVDGGLTLMAAHGHDKADPSWREI